MKYILIILLLATLTFAKQNAVCPYCVSQLKDDFQIKVSAFMI